MIRTEALDLTGVLTPPVPRAPRVNGAGVCGARPGRPVQYAIAATGEGPLSYEADGLPAGLTLDAASGVITGQLSQRGTHMVRVAARNALGVAERELRVVIGDDIALTPPMGCNTWGGRGSAVTQADVLASARAMVASGLSGHGYHYTNIDDGWQGHRDSADRSLQPNAKFPDLPGLAAELHAAGLKMGLYSSPWSTSYAGFCGGSSDTPDGAWTKPARPSDDWRHRAHRFDEVDAKQCAAWGCDYFKFDWGVDDPAHVARMTRALEASGRDIVYEVSNSVPLQHAELVTAGCQMTRTAGDLVDLWDKSQMDADKARWALGIRDLWLAHHPWRGYNRPGHWNMPCPLRVGMLGGWDDKPLLPSRLTPAEQYTHLSLWCLWSAPLIIGCPIELIDEFTMGLLTNDELLALDQDPLGVQADQFEVTHGEVLVKPLADGSLAVGLFNTGAEAAEVSVRLSELGVDGRRRVRDLWRQQDLGVTDDGVTAAIAAHGAAVVRLGAV